LSTVHDQSSSASYEIFRYTFSTWNHCDGVPAKTLAEMMGHKNVLTQFIYVRSGDDGTKQEIANRLEEELPLDRLGQMGLSFEPQSQTINCGTSAGQACSSLG
jgi:hypothetical protein